MVSRNFMMEGYISIPSKTLIIHNNIFKVAKGSQETALVCTCDWYSSL